MDEIEANTTRFHMSTPKLDFVIEQLELTGGVPMADVVEMLKELRELVARVR